VAALHRHPHGLQLRRGRCAQPSPVRTVLRHPLTTLLFSFPLPSQCTVPASGCSPRCVPERRNPFRGIPSASAKMTRALVLFLLLTILI
jgi:hypothetical protein